jgi:hypothetical protein
MTAPQLHEPLNDAVLESEVLVESGNLCDSPGRRAFTLQPRRDASVSQFPVIPDARPVEVRRGERAGMSLCSSVV